MMRLTKVGGDERDKKGEVGAPGGREQEVVASMGWPVRPVSSWWKSMGSSPPHGAEPEWGVRRGRCRSDKGESF